MIPIWLTSSFYNVFWPDGRHAAPFVTTMIVTQPFFICGPLVNGNAMRGRRPYETAVMHVNFVPNEWGPGMATATAWWHGHGEWHTPSSSRCLLGGCEGYGS